MLLALLIYINLSLRIVQISLDMYCERHIQHYEKLYRYTQLGGFGISVYVVVTFKAQV